MATPDLAAWRDANDAYLGAAVEWLRLLLDREARATTRALPSRVEPIQPSAAKESSSAPARSRWWSWRGQASDAPVTAPKPEGTPEPAPPSATASPSATEPPSATTPPALAAALERVRTLASADPPPASTILGRYLGLSPFEHDLLLLCVALELDTRIAALCARAQGDAALPFPTFGLAFRLFDAPSWDARSPERPLRYWRLIELNQPWSQSLTSCGLRADERIVNFVKGLGHLDERIAPLVGVLAEDGTAEETLPPSQRAISEEIRRLLQRDHARPQPILLLGRDAESKRLVACAAARQLGLTLYRLPAELLPTLPADLETLARLWQRETLLLPVALFVDASAVDRAADAQAPLRRFLARIGGVVFVAAREHVSDRQGAILIDVDKPTVAEQPELWRAALGEADAEAAVDLAAQFRLGPAEIARIAADARADGDTTPLRDRLWRHAAQHAVLRIDGLAQRIDAKATWSDIVLPGSETALLRQIVAHVTGRGMVYDRWGFRDRMNRGLGISALFVGESGTGKTMAAEVIANEIGLGLYRIDLSAVVSKWVGETEKNLRELFDAAEDASGILFFDEADALFGKRTEVQQSQDRFANIEINFLLQRLESFRGLAILATNLKSALDPAFLRRMRFVVSFAFPGVEERRAIWQRAFPPETPTAELDFDRLARLALTGGSVHNVALAAAFLAASRGTAVTMPIVFEAARTELRKIEKPVQEADFRWVGGAAEVAR